MIFSNPDYERVVPSVVTGMHVVSSHQTVQRLNQLMMRITMVMMMMMMMQLVTCTSLRAKITPRNVQLPTATPYSRSLTVRLLTTTTHTHTSTTDYYRCYYYYSE